MGGADVAKLYDDVGADTLYAGPLAARLVYASGKVTKSTGFGQVFARALTADSGSLDKAYLYGSSGVDNYNGYPTSSNMSGTGYYTYAALFDQVVADVTVDDATYGAVLRRGRTLQIYMIRRRKTCSRPLATRRVLTLAAMARSTCWPAALAEYGRTRPPVVQTRKTSRHMPSH